MTKPRISPFLAVLLLLWQAPLMAQTGSVFSIQLGAFNDAKADDFANLQDIGYVFAQPLNSGLSIVKLGQFEQRATAEAALGKVQAQGYPDAFITERYLAEGRDIYVNQIATLSRQSGINWANYLALGRPLLAQPSGSGAKLFAGGYASEAEAKADLAAIRAAGHADAFTRKLNSAMLEDVTAFQHGSTAPLAAKGEERPAGNDAAELGLESYDVQAMPLIMPAAPAVASTQRRNSVKALQEALKAQNAYAGSVDGVYGKGTAAGMEMMAGNYAYQRYALLAAALPEEGISAQGSGLEKAIELIPKDSRSALEELKKQKSPLAQAYQAYLLFLSKGGDAEVNGLMNGAIQESFVKRQYPAVPGFDHKATYAYQDLGQLLLHLAYVQAAQPERIGWPCWLAIRHPKESANAMQRIELPLTGCNGFMNWDDFKMLELVCKDLDPTPDSGKGQAFEKKLAEYQSQRNLLYLLPAPLSPGERTAIRQWHEKLWKGVNAWSAKDPVHAKFAGSLLLSFNQAWVQAEDYFLSKGFSAGEAEDMALAVLFTVVDPYLSSYAK